MLNIDSIVSILQVVLIALVVFAGVFFYYVKFLRPKGKSAVDSNDVKMFSGKVFPIEEYIPVEKIKDGIIKLDGEDRYIASINCKGFDFFTSSEEEIYNTQRAYLGFINTIQSPITMRIDSTAVDLSAQINNFKKIKQQRLEERDLKCSQFIEYRNAYNESVDEGERRRYEEVLYSLQRQIEVCTKKVAHLDSLINYEIKLSGRNANPLQEERYIIDWEFNPQEFPENITDAEIYDKAKKTLENRLAQMRHALSAANVKCHRDDDKDLFALSYRHFHPFGGDLYKNFEGANSEKRIVSGLRDYETAMKKYQKIIEEKEWAELVKRMENEKQEEVVVTDYDEDDDEANLGSGRTIDAEYDTEGMVSL